MREMLPDKVGARRSAVRGSWAAAPGRCGYLEKACAAPPRLQTKTEMTGGAGQRGWERTRQAQPDKFATGCAAVRASRVRRLAAHVARCHGLRTGATTHGAHSEAVKQLYDVYDRRRFQAPHARGIENEVVQVVADFTELHTVGTATEQRPRVATSSSLRDAVFQD